MLKFLETNAAGKTLIDKKPYMKKTAHLLGNKCGWKDIAKHNLPKTNTIKA